MIPGVLVDFLERASIAIASTRDDQKAPHIHWVSGWSVEPDRETVVCLIAPSFTESLVESLERNGRWAMAVERIGPHESYQFKGRYLDSRPADDGDRPAHEACRARFVEHVTHLLGDRYSRAQLRARIRPPVLAVRFRVEEIYLQTPGPGAGARLFPRES